MGQAHVCRYFQNAYNENMLRKVLKILTSRLVLVVALIAIQVAFIVSWFYSRVSQTLMPFINAAAIVLMVYIINSKEDPAYKLGWCIVILAFPVFGIVMYVLCFGRKMPAKLAHGTTDANSRMANLLSQDPAVMERLAKEDPDGVPMFRNGLRTSRFPVYQNTCAQYFGSGEEWLPVFLAKLKGAKRFIFLEYFIINPGTMWDEVLGVLKQKVAEGVQVKLIYDDLGCLDSGRNFARKMNELGIETYCFNRLRPALAIQMNNRDHRKICVIDNTVGFTGGVNISDEYANRIVRFGYWRDSAIMIEGEAVWSLTVMFLGMYTYLKKDDEGIDYSRYKLPYAMPEQPSGYFQPFSDTPTDAANAGLSVHMNLVLQARKYVYIDTPYLILAEPMKNALCLAGDNGIDVRILTPHIPDKKIAFTMTRSNYQVLLEHGVKIYEYTPGFNHTKNIVSDDLRGTVGTVNTDYRSYYLHFENGVLFEDSATAVVLRDAFLKGLEQAQEVTLEDTRHINIFVRIFSAVANLFAPLF